MTATDPQDSDRQLNTVQCSNFYTAGTEYFKLITDHMDRKMVAERIKKISYYLLDLPELEKDLQLNLKEPGSQVYKDAVISNIIESKAADCVAGLTARQSRGRVADRGQINVS